MHHQVNWDKSKVCGGAKINKTKAGGHEALRPTFADVYCYPYRT